MDDTPWRIAAYACYAHAQRQGPRTRVVGPEPVVVLKRERALYKRPLPSPSRQRTKIYKTRVNDRHSFFNGSTVAVVRKLDTGRNALSISEVIELLAQNPLPALPLRGSPLNPPSSVGTAAAAPTTPATTSPGAAGPLAAVASPPLLDPTRRISFSPTPTVRNASTDPIPPQTWSVRLRDALDWVGRRFRSLTSPRQTIRDVSLAPAGAPAAAVSRALNVPTRRPLTRARAQAVPAGPPNTPAPAPAVAAVDAGVAMRAYEAYTERTVDILRSVNPQLASAYAAQRPDLERLLTEAAMPTSPPEARMRACREAAYIAIGTMSEYAHRNTPRHAVVSAYHICERALTGYFWSISTGQTLPAMQPALPGLRDVISRTLEHVYTTESFDVELLSDLYSDLDSALPPLMGELVELFTEPYADFTDADAGDVAPEPSTSAAAAAAATPTSSAAAATPTSSAATPTPANASTPSTAPSSGATAVLPMTMSRP